ncbi:MAG: hypothetical protein J07AB43_00560 [Candidatus Nanosalina sp. J07AB43]|nr:MAG: hypothetical protein J07AB43_00560 [Candidatus Nanosalina sp. J07AB43]
MTKKYQLKCRLNDCESEQTFSQSKQPMTQTGQRFRRWVSSKIV